MHLSLKILLQCDHGISEFLIIIQMKAFCSRRIRHFELNFLLRTEVFEKNWEMVESKNESYHIIARRRNPIGFLPEVWIGVHYRLLSTCVGSFTCPGIGARVQGTTVFSLIRQTLFVFTT
jgi:hypothetical protein